MPPRNPRTLDDLLEILRADPAHQNDGASATYARAHGLPTAHGVADWTDLPTFGGGEPADTVGVWSWDPTRLLVGTCANDLRIVHRAAYELGRLGGQATSPAKRRAARANGQKGGRPRKRRP